MTYSYDTETPNSNPYSLPHPNGNDGLYNQSAPNIITVAVGGYTFQNDLNNLDYLVSLTRSTTDDTYQVTSTNNVFPTEDYSGVYGISWQISYSPNTFADSDLPITKPDIENYDINRIWIYADRSFQIVAIPTSVEIIPEPITLLTLGFGSLVVIRGRKNK